jgi:photosystem II stability/assembly factor-like uncharacterized protein
MAQKTQEELNAESNVTNLNLANEIVITIPASEIIAAIEGVVVEEEKLDITALKNRSVLNADQFEVVAGVHQIKTDVVPTESSLKFVNSGNLHSLLSGLDVLIGNSVLGYKFEFRSGSYPSDVNINGIIPVVEGFVMYGSWWERICYSKDGANFISLPGTQFSMNPTAHTRMGSKIMIVGRSSTSGTENAILSTDEGVTWSILTTPSGVDLYDVTSIGNRWVACSNVGTGNRVIYSDDDGVTWIHAATPADVNYRGIISGNGILILVSQDGNDRIYRSTDRGLTFAASGLGTFGAQPWGKGIFFKDKFIIGSIGGSNKKLLVSNDLGLTFSHITNGNDAVDAAVRSFTIMGDYLFSTTNNGIISRTTDGINWEVMTSPLPGRNITAIAGNMINGFPVVVLAASSGVGNRVQTSLRLT